MSTRDRERLLDDRSTTAQSRNSDGSILKIAVTGATGMIGRPLVRSLGQSGHHVRRLVRTQPEGDDIVWQPQDGTIDGPELEGMDAVIHLAGESIAGRRWTKAQMARIRDSRAAGTALLARTLAALNRPPQALLSASAIGFYGDRGNEQLDESSGPGRGFLADVGQAWEAATVPAAEAGIRVVLMRNGLVLGSRGGALARMLPVFRAGLGGRLGTGRQWMSWISLDDTLGAIQALLADRDTAGPVNMVAPNPATNAEFTRTLATVLRRPAWLPVPAVGLRLAVGALADEALLASTRVTPARLRDIGYQFKHPTLKQALEHAVDRSQN